MFLINRRFREAVIVSTLAFASVAAQAATITFRAKLDAASEVPAKTSDGKGTVKATLNTDTEEFTYHIEFSGLTGPATAAHFHGPAAPGANAGPQLPIKAASIASPLDGTATLTPEQAKDLLEGKWYFNVHTSANPGGEIRGQLVKGK
ncbi:CHRD domain-containing protein [Granulicella sp. WH15]|uniref:CHRD domain-containing protein n=1 Tax=Granulicella sp. WH15 TaxID=2602070 RepID=UPI0013678BAB|nr:CHRD domain-containing protein [Granulicella sp. WH15]QHN02832.1 CHRD domain-containing protein [Granulicella sp. WH15]